MEYDSGTQISDKISKSCATTELMDNTSALYRYLLHTSSSMGILIQMAKSSG